jgi:hypothetical protein
MSAITQPPEPTGQIARAGGGAFAAGGLARIRRADGAGLRRVAQRVLGVVDPVTWKVFLASRLLVWLAGGLAMQIFGVFSSSSPVFGTAGSWLTRFALAPSLRWDAIEYLDIAAHGYRNLRDVSFSPLLPVLIRAVSLVTGSLQVAGVLIGIVACLAALEAVRRLTAFELGDAVSRRAVTLLAFGPMSLFLSAMYTDGLYVALAASAFLSARRGRWARAGLLGALAAVARPVGWLLLPALLVLYAYGPRADLGRYTTIVPARLSTRWIALWPRYRLRADVVWLAPMIVLPVAFSVYLGLHGYGAFGTINAQRHFMQHSVTMPWVGAWEGLRAGGEAAVGVLTANAAVVGTQALAQAVALIIVTCAVVGTFRRLPLAYGIGAILPLLVHLSSPTHGDPLKGFARYASMRFALFMWAAQWSLEHRVRRRVLASSMVLLALFTAQFATWHMVASLAL